MHVLMTLCMHGSVHEWVSRCTAARGHVEKLTCAGALSCMHSSAHSRSTTALNSPARLQNAACRHVDKPERSLAWLEPDLHIFACKAPQLRLRALALHARPCKRCSRGSSAGDLGPGLGIRCVSSLQVCFLLSSAGSPRLC